MYAFRLDMNNINIILIVSAISCTKVEGSVEIIKCCQEGEILNLSYDCIKKSDVNFIEAAKKSQARLQIKNTNLIITERKTPVCDYSLEHHEVNKWNAITSSGGASSYKYKDALKKDDVCFDILEDQTGYLKFVFLSCDPCKENTCLNLCCPHGQAHKDDQDAEEEKSHRCDLDPGIQKSCLAHEHEDLVWGEEDLWDGETIFRKKNKKDVRFVSSGGFFKCHGKKSTLPAEFLFGPHNSRLQSDGLLHVLFDGKGTSTTEVYNASEFCLSFTDIPEYDDYYEDLGLNESSYETSTTFLPIKIRALYRVCHQEKAQKGEQFTSIFYPAAIFISCFFLLVTAIIYCILQDLRSILFGKLTLGFLCNAFVCYFFLGINYSLNLKENKEFLNTNFCIILGYIIHHTFIGFFFWTSAMAINITHKFSNILVSTQGENQKKGLTLNILYAQGLPIIITTVTALIDAYGSCDAILPNMGRYSCFLGSEFNPNPSIFISSPEFLYFYSIIIIIMISNLICFIITGYFLTSHRSTVRNMQTSNDDNLWKHINVVVKIFFIMGIPWTLDVISAAIENQHGGGGKTFAVRVALDILNLLTGLVIFLVLICKKTVFNKIDKKFSTIFQKTSRRKTQLESINLRKFSNMSTFSDVSTKAAKSEVFLEEEKYKNKSRSN